MNVGLDFETETDINGNCRPLLCALWSKEYQEVFDLTIREEYIKFYYTIITSGDKYVVFNAGFDVEIIMIMLLKNGFSYLSNEQKPHHKSMRLTMGQKIYQLVTYYEDKGSLIETSYIDLGNILVGSTLKDIAKKFTDLEKGDYEATKDNLEEFKKYNLLDAQITVTAYNNICKFLGKEYITIGSASFNIMLEMNFSGKNRKERMKQFKRVYGDNTLEEDNEMRKWYAGGLGWASTDERTEVSINSYDLKSAYPAESEGRLPTTINKRTYKGYREPTQEYPFAFIHMKVTGQVKEDYVPVLPSRNIYGDSNIYIYDDKDVYIIQEYGVMSEYDYFMENIEIDSIEYIETTLLQEAKTNPIFKFMDKYFQMKERTKGIEREFAKRIINSFSGKCGTNPNKQNIKYKVDENYKLIRDEVEDTITEVYCTHVIALITSRVRCKCYNADKLIRGKVSFRMYATDSVKHSTGVQVIPTGDKWGSWQLEHEDTEFIFLGLKAYIFDANNKKGEREVMCAGVSKNYKKLITNEQFYSTTQVKSLISVRAGNGRVIYEGLKRIASPVKKPRRREQLNGRYKKDITKPTRLKNHKDKARSNTRTSRKSK